LIEHFTEISKFREFTTFFSAILGHSHFIHHFFKHQCQPTEIRKNKLVFIGRNLDAEKLRNDFKACLV